MFLRPTAPLAMRSDSQKEDETKRVEMKHNVTKLFAAGEKKEKRLGGHV